MQHSPQTPKNKILVVYHANCADGFTAAWLMYKYSACLPAAEFVFHAALYHETCPPQLLETSEDKDQYIHVYMVDFSYPRPALDAMMARFPETNFTLIDHHKTAMEALLDKPGLICRCSSEYCGAMGVFKFISRPELKESLPPGYALAGILAGHAPWFLAYINDRDLWKHELPHTKEVNAYIGSLDYTFENWDALEQLGVEQVILKGEALLQYRQKTVAGLCKGRQLVDLFGYSQVPTVNTSGAFASDTGDALSKLHPEAPMTMTYHFAYGKLLCSLRSPQGTGADVSEVAKVFGGGGHKHASGCNIAQDHPQYHQILTTLNILPSQE